MLKAHAALYEKLELNVALPADEELARWSERSLKGEIQKHVELSRAIIDRVESEGRKLSREENTELARLDADMNRLEAAITAKGNGAGNGERREIRPDVGGREPAPAAADGGLWVDLKTGKEVRALTPKDRFADAVQSGTEHRGLSVGRWARGWATGKWDHAPREQRLLQVGDFAAGGATVPTPIANQIIDLARDRSVVVAMGARTIPMDAPTLDLVRVTGDPSATWFGGDETRAAGIPESQGSFGRLQLQSQTVAILERLSIELAEDAVNFGSLFENAIGQAAALAIDKAVLYGVGPGARDGLRTWLSNDATNSINEVTSAANGDQVTDFSKFISATQKVLEGKCPLPPEDLGIVWAPRTWGVVAGLKEATTNAPLRGPDFFNAQRKLTSTQISVTETQGSSNIASTVFVGDWSQVVIGMRTAPRIELSREAGDSFSRLHILLRLYARLDWAILQPKFMTRVIGLIP